MSTPQPVRLTAGARILRGAKRIGALLGALVFLLTTALTVGFAYDAARREGALYAQSLCLSRKASASLIRDQYGYNPPEYRFAENGCPGSAYSASEAEMRATVAAGPPAFLSSVVSAAGLGLALATLAAACVFGLCWGLGWVAAGFTAD